MNAPTDASTGAQERVVKWVGLAVGIVASVATLLADGEIELTLFMVAAVVAALATFDAALDRRTQSFGPWILVSLGIIAKSVPTVLARLNEQAGPSAERSDHLGSILLAVCVGAALVAGLVLANKYGRQSGRLLALAALAPIVAGVAFAATAFGGQGEFSSRRVAWILETAGWASAGLILGAAVLLAGTLRRVSPPLTMLIVGAAAVAALVAITSKGSNYDLGWWALACTVFSLGTLPFSVPRLALRSGATESIVPVIVAVLLAIVAVRSAIVGLGDAGTWRLGAILLPALAIAALAIGIPMFRNDDSDSAEMPESVVPNRRREDQPDGLLTEVDSADRSVAAAPAAQVVAPPPGLAAAGDSSAFTAALAGRRFDDIAGRSPVPAEPLPAAVDAEVAGPGRSEPVFPESVVDEPVFSQPEVVQAAPLPDPAPIAAPEPVVPAPIAAPEPVVPEPVAPAPIAPPEPVVAAPAAAATSIPVEATESPARAANLDPATGLVPATQLQTGILAAFNSPPADGSVAILMIALRNLEELERVHGRVASAHILRELAGRFRTAMPHATTARFAATAFAGLIVDNGASMQQLIDSSTAVLLDLLEPVAISAGIIEVDVAASLAQSKPDEDAQAFVNRANTGLQRAVRTPDPSLVAMP